MRHSDKDEQIYYVVTNGRNPGIYKDYEQAQEQIEGYPFGKMKKIVGLREAKNYFASERRHAHKERIYYVVKRGRLPGLYLDKEKALEQIENFPNGKMKRIKGYQRAVAYYTSRDESSGQTIPNIYIDGSYVQESKLASYGLIVEAENEIVQRDCGVIVDYDFLNLHSLGAEMYAYLRALEWSMANGYKNVRIIYDSDAVIQLIAQGDTTKTKKSKGRSKFIKLYKQYTKVIDVESIHKSDAENYAERHEQAHHLSQLTIDLLVQANNNGI